MRQIALVLAAMAAVASATGCAASQPQPTTPGVMVAEENPVPQNPASRRCIRKIRVVGAAWAAGYAPKTGAENNRASTKAHAWGRSLSCPRGGASIGPW